MTMRCRVEQSGLGDGLALVAVIVRHLIGVGKIRCRCERMSQPHALVCGLNSATSALRPGQVDAGSPQPIFFGSVGALP